MKMCILINTYYPLQIGQKNIIPGQKRSGRVGSEYIEYQAKGIAHYLSLDRQCKQEDKARIY